MIIVTPHASINHIQALLGLGASTELTNVTESSQLEDEEHSYAIVVVAIQETSELLATEDIIKCCGCLFSLIEE